MLAAIFTFGIASTASGIMSETSKDRKGPKEPKAPKELRVRKVRLVAKVRLAHKV